MKTVLIGGGAGKLGACSSVLYGVLTALIGEGSSSSTLQGGFSLGPLELET